MKIRFLTVTLVAILVASFCLMSVTSSKSGFEPMQIDPEYDPWIDLNDGGDINLYDAVLLLTRYGSSGVPINKTELLLDLQSRVTSLEEQMVQLANGTCIAEGGKFDGEVQLNMVQTDPGAVIIHDFENPFTTIEKPIMVIIVAMKGASDGLVEGANIRVVEDIKGVPGNWTGFDLTVSKYGGGNLSNGAKVFVIWIAIGSNGDVDGRCYTFGGSLDGQPFEVSFPVEWATFSRVEVTATGYKYNTMDYAKQGPLIIVSTVDIDTDKITFEVWDMNGNEYDGSGWAGMEAHIDFVAFGTP